MKDTQISVVSYKRPKNRTCDMLSETSLNWSVYVYYFDPFLWEYKNNYGSHVRVITEFNKANLAKKRQLVLDDAKDKDYCIMIDDDILDMLDCLTEEHLDMESTIRLLRDYAEMYPEYTMLSPRYNYEDTNIIIYEGKQMNCMSIIDMKKMDVKYNEESECEDIELCINLIEKGHLIGRISTFQVNGQLQDTNGDSGNSYRYTSNDANRFIKEGKYLQRRFPEYKEAIIYDDKKVKYDYNKIKNCLQIKNNGI